MFAALFGKSNPRQAALDALRRMYIDQMNGHAGHDLGRILATERRIWGRVLAVFRIDPTRGVDANLPHIDELIAACRALSGRFDYLGIAIPTLLQNSGFLPVERDALSGHLAACGVMEPARSHIAGRAMNPRPSYGAPLVA